MERIQGADVAEDLFGAGKDGFTDGVPGTTTATVVTDKFMNEVQEELVSLIEGAGLTPDSTTTQVAAAIAATFWKFSNVNGIAAVAGNLKTFSDFRYCGNTGVVGYKTRTKLIPLTSGHSVLSSQQWQIELVDGSDKYHLAVGNPNQDQIVFPLNLPSGALPSQIRIATTQSVTAVTADIKAEVFRVGVDKTVSAGPAAWTPVVDSYGSATASDAGDDVLTISLGSLGAIDNETYEYVLKVTSSSAGSGADTIDWIEVTFDDPGPRNF